MKVLERGMLFAALVLSLSALMHSAAQAQYGPAGMPPSFGQAYAAPPGGPGFGPPPGYGPGGHMPYPGVMPASAMGPAGGPMEMAPGHYQGPAGGPPMSGPGGPMGYDGYGGGDCPNCGGNGCDNCNGHGCCGWLCGLLGFGEGYKCRPRWFDASIDYMYLKREDVSRTVQLTPLVSTDAMDFDGANGARVTFCGVFAAGTHLEATYMGSFGWETSAVAADTALTDRVVYDSALDSVEIHIRQRWQEPECRYQCSWLAGFRYVRLDEELDIDQAAAAGPFDQVAFITTDNDLYGAQVGLDFVLRPLPKLLMSAEGKIGLYGNAATTSTTFQNDTLEDANSEAALVAEFNTNIVWHITERWSLRGGYTLLYIDGIALAPENANPADFTAQPDINVNGDVFLHGVNAGMEFSW